MWLIFNLKKEFDKIKNSFKQRDSKINKLKEKIETNSLKIATLEGSYLILSQSQSQNSLKKSQNNFETKLIQRIKHNKKSLVIAEIMKLINNHSTTEIFNIIVSERGLCSKASFYRYISSLKSQNLLETETTILELKH